MGRWIISPIEADGASYVDTMYSKAYLRHLFHAQELLAMQIASIHNLAFYLWLAGEARKHIIAGDFCYLETDDGETRIDKIMKTKWNWKDMEEYKAVTRGKFLKRLDWYIIKKFLGTYCLCHRIDYLHCGGVRLQREDGPLHVS